MEHQQKGLFNVLIKEKFQRPSSYCFPTLDHISESLHYVAKLQLPLKNCLTLRHLVTGDAHITIGLSYRLTPTTVGGIIRETTQVIWNCLVEKGHMNAPRPTREWRQIPAEFTEQWNFPHCVGAIDGRRVNIQSPARSSLTYFN